MSEGFGEAPGDGVIAGRLEIPVVSDLTGFAERLKLAVEAVAEKIQAKVDVVLNLDADRLREEIETKVREAAAGVVARIGTKVEGIAGEVAAATEEGQAVADANPVDVPVETDKQQNWRKQLAEVLSQIQKETDKKPVNVPLRIGGGGSFRSIRGPLIFLGLLSLLQPAVAVIGQLVGGLFALASAAAPALGILAGFPAVLGAFVGAMTVGKVILGSWTKAVGLQVEANAKLAAGQKLTKDEQQKLNESMKGLPPAARESAREVAALAKSWAKLRLGFQERFFSQVLSQFRPLSTIYLPIFAKAGNTAAETLGRLAREGAQTARSPAFSGRLTRILGTLNFNLDHGGKAAGFLASAFLRIVDAAGPMTREIVGSVEAWTRWLDRVVQAKQESGALARFFDDAKDTAGKLIGVVVNLAGGIRGLGGAAREAGDSILNDLLEASQNFSDWANSPEGFASAKEFFRQSADTVRRVGNLVVAVGQALGRLAKDGTIGDLIDQIRTQMLPALEHLFDTLGRTTGHDVVDLVSDLAVALDHLSDAGSGLDTAIRFLDKIVETFNWLSEHVPGFSSVIGNLLGFALVLKILRGIGKLTGLEFAIKLLLRMTGLDKKIKNVSNAIKGFGQSAKTYLGTAGLRGVVDDLRIALGKLFSKATATKILSGGVLGALKRAAAAVKSAGPGRLLTKVGGKAIKGGGPIGIAAGIGAGLLGSAVDDRKGGWRSFAGGALQGAATGASTGGIAGAAVGALGGPIGAGAGALIGGLGGALIGGLTNSRFGRELVNWAKETGTKAGHALTDAWDATTSAIGDWSGDVTGAVSGAWDDVVSATESKWSDIESTVTGVFDRLKRKAIEVAAPIAAPFARAGRGVASAEQAVVGPPVAAATSAVELAGGTVSAVQSVLGQGLLAAWDVASTALEGAAQVTWETIKGGAELGWVAIGAATQIGLDSLGAIAQGAWDELKDEAATTWSDIEDQATIAGGLIAGAVLGIGGLVSDGWDFVARKTHETWDDISSFTSRKWNELRDYVSPVTDYVGQHVKDGWDFVARKTHETWDDISSFTSRKWNELFSAIAGPIDRARAYVAEKTAGIRSSIASAGASAKASIASAFQSIVNSIRTKLGEAENLVKSLPGRIKSAIGNPGGLLYEAGRSIMQGLINGITHMMNPLGSAVSDAAGLVKDHWNFSPAKRGPLAPWAMVTAGKNIVRNLISGVKSKTPDLSKGIADLAGVVANEHLNANINVGATLGRVGAAGLQAAAPAALIGGDLKVETKDGADAGEIVDEILFAFRRIRRGGVYQLGYSR